MWTPFPMSRSPFAKKKTSFAEATWPHTCISHSSVAHWHWLWLCHWDAIHSSSRTRSPISRAMELFTCRTYLYRIWRNKKKGNMSVLLPILLISLLSAVYLSVGICGRICEWTRRVDSHVSVRVQSTAPNHGTLNVIGRSCGVSNWFWHYYRYLPSIFLSMYWCTYGQTRMDANKIPMSDYLPLCRMKLFHINAISDQIEYVLIFFVRIMQLHWNEFVGCLFRAV